MSQEVDKVKEIQRVKEALKANNYPDWMLTIPNTGSALRDSEESVNEKRIYASVPYIKGTSERLQIAFKSYKVTLVHKPFNSLRSQLVHVRDKTENCKKCGTVYHIHREQCDKDYVGETSRLLETRVKEHLSRNRQLFMNIASSRVIQWIPAKQKFFATESNTFKRRRREAIEIKLRKPSLNRDNGFELASIYDTILAPSGTLYNPS